MADDAGTPPGEGGESTGPEGQNEVANSIPTQWAENDSYKEYFSEDGSFDFERFDTALGELKGAIRDVPESYTYEFTDDHPFEEADIEAQRQMAKDAGLTQEQYEAVVNFDIAQVSREADAMAKERETAKSALLKEWGSEVKFKENLAAAAKVANDLFGEDFANRTDLGNDPQLLKGLYHISQKLSEDSFKPGSGVNSDQRKVGVDGESLFSYKDL